MSAGGGPSDEAVWATYPEIYPRADKVFADEIPGFARKVLEAAHDPELGLDRSVCLRDVVNALRSAGVNEDEWRPHLAPANFIEREFGGGR